MFSFSVKVEIYSASRRTTFDKFAGTHQFLLVCVPAEKDAAHTTFLLRVK
jgi:hypothetical protein